MGRPAFFKWDGASFLVDTAATFLIRSFFERKKMKQESDNRKNRLLQERETLSHELEHLRKELESTQEKFQALQSALQSKDELLQHLKIEHRAYRDLLTSSLQSDQHPDNRPAFQPDSNPDPALTKELNRAERRIEELELKLLDREEELGRISRKRV